MDNLIIIEQLPIIAERLESIKNEVLSRVKYAESCACTVDTVKEIKKYRAELTKEFDTLEQQRKDVKNQVLEPYNTFEKKYKECISDTYKNADMVLKSKIAAVENELKAEKEQAVREYFVEYAKANNVDWLSFDRSNIAITISASDKKLKETAKRFVDGVASDMMVILMQNEEDQPELIAEYKKSLNLKNTIETVQERHRQIADIKAAEEEFKKKEADSVRHEQEIQKEALAAPKVISEQSKKYKAVFTVIGTLEELKELKMFMESLKNKGGFTYEC